MLKPKFLWLFILFVSSAPALLFAQTSNVGLFFFTTTYASGGDSTLFMERQANTIKDDLMYEYGFRASSYANYSQVNLINSIENECMEDSTKQVFVYIGGRSHLVNDNVYVLLHDSNTEDLSTMIGLQNLAAIMRNCKAQNVLLFADVPGAAAIADLENLKALENQPPDSTFTRPELIKQSFASHSVLYMANSEIDVDMGSIRRFSNMSAKLLEAMRNYGGHDGILSVEELGYFVTNMEPAPFVGSSTTNDYENFLFILK